METFFQDIRYGLRSLVKKPGFTVVAVLTLALGIGANSAIFSVVNAVILRPLPYPEPDRLFTLSQTSPNDKEDDSSISYLNFKDWRDQAQTFEQMAAFQYANFTLKAGDAPERVPGLTVSADIFPMLGVAPSLGRTFTGQEEKSQVALISHSLWQKRFASDAEIVGKPMTIDSQPFTIIGVLPSSFIFPPEAGPDYPEVWLPLAVKGPFLEERDAEFLTVAGRLKPGVTVEQAQAEMDTIARRLEEQYPESNQGSSIHVLSMHEKVVKDVRTALFFLLFAVAFVLAVACANVANLMLARASSRQREIAIRSALGATRFRIIRQLMTESLMLALAGGSLGLLLAMWGVDALAALGPDDIPRLSEVTLDLPVTLFTVAASLVTGLIFGLAPALHVSRLDLNETLKESSRGTAGPGRNRLRNAFVILEVAISLVLLVCAGLMMRSFYRLSRVDPGFDPENTVAMDVLLPDSRYAEPEEWTSFYDRLLDKVRTQPGVESAGAVTTLPLSEISMSISFEIEGRPPSTPADKTSANYRAVSHDYFRAIGIRVIRGRAFNERDNEKAPKVMVINQTMAEKFWPDDDPIGKRVKIGYNDIVAEVVGIVGDVKHKSLRDQSGAEMYLPYQQTPFWFMSLVVRTRSDSQGIAALVKDALASLDPDIPIYNVKTMGQYVNASLEEPRFTLLLLALFAAVATILASIGIYGVISYSVAERTHEIGIRQALGATGVDVMKMVLKHTSVLASIGVWSGIAAAFALTRLMESMLFEISATDTATFVVIPLMLFAVAIAASLIPARRATRVDPIVALRCE